MVPILIFLSLVIFCLLIWLSWMSEKGTTIEQEAQVVTTAKTKVSPRQVLLSRSTSRKKLLRRKRKFRRKMVALNRHHQWQ